jgi:nicotinamide riboside kinase
MPTTRIALLGAQGTGKTTLAQALAAHLCARGMAALAVPDALQAWCARAARAPQPQEQWAIAQAQEESVERAAATAAVVIADTTALMVAIRAGVPSPGEALLDFALERQRGYDATLVGGLDLAWPPGRAQAEPPREAADALVREHLQRAGLAYQVVYGRGEQRLQAALQALEGAGVLPAGTGTREEEGSRGDWVWNCEKCSDPACEHRLFAKLRAAR